MLLLTTVSVVVTVPVTASASPVRNPPPPPGGGGSTLTGLPGQSDAPSRGMSQVQAAQFMASVGGQGGPATPDEKAMKQALLTRKPVEVPEKASARSQVLANPDGKFKARISKVPFRFQDAKGQWEDLDPSVAAQPDGSFRQKAGPAEGARFAKAASPAVASIGSPASGVYSWGPEGAAPAAGAARGTTVTYKAALPGGRDIVETSTASGAEETVVVPSVAAGGSWTDTVTVPPGLLARSNAQGIVEFVDSKGAVVSTFGGGMAYDSAALPSGEGAHIPVSAVLLGQSGTHVRVQFSVDQAWLADPARVFPVMVDPQFQWGANTLPGALSGGQDAYVDSKYHTTAEGAYDPNVLKIGTASNGAEVYRTYVQYPLDPLVSTNDIIDQADLDVYNTWSWSCNTGATPAAMVAAVASPWDASRVTWEYATVVDSGLGQLASV